MPNFVPVRGDTLLILGTGPANDPDRGHLFILLTNVCSEGAILLAPIRSVRGQHDRTCLLGVGDHRFLKGPSWISYAQCGYIVLMCCKV